MAKNQKYYDPKLRLKLVKDFEASGLGVMEYCENVGISPNTFHVWRSKVKRGESLENKGKTGPIDPAKRIQAVEAYLKSGMTFRDFARTYGVGESSITRWARIYREKGPKALG